MLLACRFLDFGHFSGKAGAGLPVTITEPTWFELLFEFVFKSVLVSVSELVSESVLKSLLEFVLESLYICKNKNVMQTNQNKNIENLVCHKIY